MKLNSIKKVLSMILTISMIGSLNVPINAEEVPNDFTTIDLLKVKKHILNIMPVDIVSKYDFNGDGTISITDEVALKQILFKALDNNIPKNALELTQAMGNGWNLGNTLEACGDWIAQWGDGTTSSYETAWGNPVTTKAMIDGLKQSGINSVRIPVSWSNMMTDTENYTISQEYFNRVDEVVSYVLDNDMYAIINIHYDNNWWVDFGTDDQSYNEALKKYRSMWTQIATHYKDYSNKLIFESANEELGDKFKENNSNLNDDYCYDLTNKINQMFVDIVRGTNSGNNKDRFLLIAGYNTDIDKTCNDRFIMPTDTIENHLLVSVHYYSPSTYCIANTEGNSWGYMDSWGTDEDYKYMENQLSKMQKFINDGYGVIIGEYGVATKKISDTEYIKKDGTDKFMQSVLDLSDKYNYCPLLWDAGDWYDRNSCTFKYDDIANVFNK
ncbi:MAG: cellulase family glycosylhydrolase [Oscillospiraceae bacterium]